MDQITLLKRDIATLKMQQTESVELFRALQKQVGTNYGEQIDEHIASLEGRKHNAMAWDLSDKNGEQGR
jgi:hypothetical protein